MQERFGQFWVTPIGHNEGLKDSVGSEKGRKVAARSEGFCTAALEKIKGVSSPQMITNCMLKKWTQLPTF